MNFKSIVYKIKKTIINPLLNDEKNNKRAGVYNREAAKAYAEMYAESHNTKYPLFKENDCTNFVSQVLTAGGMKQVGQNYDSYQSWFCYTNDAKQLKKISLSWRSGRYFRRYWGNENGFGENAAKIFKEMTVLEALNNFDELYDFLEIGDVIQYGNPQNNNYPYHSQVIHAKEYNIVLGKNDLFMAQHSVNRKNVSLYDYLKLLQNKEIRNIYIYHID